jgi:RIO kinase 1
VAGKDVYDIIHEKYDKRWKREELIVDADRFKTYDEVFDRQNLDNIFKLMKKGSIRTLECPISTGKEANVYKARTDEGFAAVKIYRTSNSTFGAFLDYIIGDRRFQKIDRSHRGIIYTWAKKEEMNLKAMVDAGIRAPAPHGLFKNVLVMDYIEYEGGPAPQLRVLRTEPDHWVEMWKDVMRTVKKLYRKCGLVHGDLSEYNILYDGKPVYMDVGQSVDKDHPRARELLKRDLSIISLFFQKKGVPGAEAAAMRLYSELIPAQISEEPPQNR